MVCTSVLGGAQSAPPVGLLNARFTVSSGSTVASGQKFKTACLTAGLTVGPRERAVEVDEVDACAARCAAGGRSARGGGHGDPHRALRCPGTDTLIATAVDDPENAWVAVLNWMVPPAPSAVFV